MFVPANNPVAVATATAGALTRGQPIGPPSSVAAFWPSKALGSSDGYSAVRLRCSVRDRGWDRPLIPVLVDEQYPDLLGELDRLAGRHPVTR
jgi:hypothetical protein